MLTRTALHRFTRPGHPTVSVTVLPHAGGSASYFRCWVPAAQRLGVELTVMQYPGHEELFSEAPASTLEEMSLIVGETIRNEAERTVLFGHSMGGLLAYETAIALAGQDRELLGLHISGSRAPDQPVSNPRHELPDERLVASIAAMSPDEPCPLEDEQLAAVLLPQVRLEMRLAETHHRAPLPLAIPIILHMGTEDPDFSAEDAPAWERFTSSGTELLAHPGHHFYLGSEAAAGEILESIIARIPREAEDERNTPCNS